MKIYTRTGDGGETGLFAGSRVRKDDPRIEAFGTVDELNAALGLARAAGCGAASDACLEAVQHELFAVGAELATPDPQRHGTAWIGTRHVERLEEAIDGAESQLPPLREFVLPGGTVAASHLHVARAVCRRAERRLTTLAAAEPKSDFSRVTCYLNRLGDLLFVLARRVNHDGGAEEQPWQKPE